MSAFKAYDGSSFRNARRLQAYDGSTWRDIKRVQVYDGSTWRDATPPMISSLTATDDVAPTWTVAVAFISTAVGSYRWRFREEAGAYSAWSTVNGPTSPDTSPTGSGTAGNQITVQVQPYSATALGGDAGPTYELAFPLS